MLVRPIEKIIAKVQRANQHIRDFELAQASFIASNPYRVCVEEDPSGKNASYYISKMTPTPSELAVIAADAINNLRSALDNLAFQIVSDANGGEAPTWKVYFPISMSAADYKGTRIGCIRGVRKEIIDQFDEIQPYKGGKGHSLWQLKELNNADKHKIPLGAGVYSPSIDIAVDFSYHMSKVKGFEHVEVPPLFLNPAQKILPLKVGDVIFIGPAQPEVVQKRRFVFDISIHAPSIIDPEPAIKTLKGFSTAVGAIISNFERFIA